MKIDEIKKAKKVREDENEVMYKNQAGEYFNYNKVTKKINPFVTFTPNASCRDVL
ncbi:hypothetical protein [Lactobacillus crispatus]|jgi:hypothetical protein|uniref:hypothetical protein n=1 Tax=Lactobacillus crispatus TaxID=47770 RepID=UPI001414E29F|nr:hypothetical protein [Lactobacillus crispatus]MBH9539000.1 hypothetical protein [Lactobacillus crispatus]MCT7774696.1 hypothetical protein [Lactobacillus crispatus]MCZ3559139.1 hypothetical protein [Lactobacillus crispatus]MCZ3561234.1 hypothetical protein [Lactobacillus crispatus]MCZ3563387.1 hypothetical protein [Lactobacillus crispatus]